MITKCSEGFYHIGSTCCRLDKYYGPQEVNASHTCGSTQETNELGAVFFKIFVKGEECAARKIWTALGGKPEGDMGCVVNNFIEWYRQKERRKVVTLRDLELCCLPSQVAGCFGHLSELDLSDNRGLSKLPGTLRVTKLNISGTGIKEVPFYTAQIVVMTGIWVELSKEDLHSKNAVLRRLTIDDQILQGVFPWLTGSCLEYIKIGDYKGTPEEVDEQTLENRRPMRQSSECTSL